MIRTHDRRLLWSAQPEGARGAVITDEATADDLILAVRKYEVSLPRHLEAARRQLASVPDTNIGRDKAAVLAALVAALEVLATRTRVNAVREMGSALGQVSDSDGEES